MASLALATNISPRELLASPRSIVASMHRQLVEQNRQRERERKRRR